MDVCKKSMIVGVDLLFLDLRVSNCGCGCHSVVWTSIYRCTASNRVQEPHRWRPENRPPAVMSGADDGRTDS